MSYCISPLSHSRLPYPDFQGFEPSCITVIEGSSRLVPDVLFRLCVSSVVSPGRDAIFVDGWNSFNPFTFSKMAKSFGAEPRKVLSRIHVARAFTEYHMDALMGESLYEAIECWNPALLAISYLPSLFSGKDGRKLLEPLLERLKLLTESSGFITAVTSFGGSWYGDRLLASRADRVIRIEQPTKKLVRIIDDGYVFEYIFVPPGQLRFTDFADFDLAGGDSYGQNSALLSHAA
jgi:hypothetical protein